MVKFAIRAAVAALAAGVAMPVFAADIQEPIVEPAPVAPIAYEEPDVGGWYIRGDVDYHWSDLDGADYITYGPNGEGGVGTFDTTDLKGAMSLGAGVGYQIDDHFRVDLTGDYWFDSDFRGSTSGVCGGLPARPSTRLRSTPSCCWPMPMSTSAPITASRLTSAPVSVARGSIGTICATKFPACHRWSMKARQLALRLRGYGRRILLPDQPAQTRRRLSLLAHRGWPHVRNRTWQSWPRF